MIVVERDAAVPERGEAGGDLVAQDPRASWYFSVSRDRTDQARSAAGIVVSTRCTRGPPPGTMNVATAVHCASRKGRNRDDDRNCG